MENKILVPTILLMLFSLPFSVLGASIFDSYGEGNYNEIFFMYNGSKTRIGQSFTGKTGALDSVEFYLSKAGTPTGNVVATIYAHYGEYGVDSQPIADTSPLAISDTIDIATLSTTSQELVIFTFSGEDRITLIGGNYYVIAVEFTGGDSGENWLKLGVDTSSPTHSGNYSQFIANWGGSANIDVSFYVYGIPTPPITAGFDEHLPDYTMASTTAYIGGLVSSTGGLIWLAMGIPLGFFVIKRVISLVAGREK